MKIPRREFISPRQFTCRVQGAHRNFNRDRYTMLISYVIITHNRRDVLLASLVRLREATHLPIGQWEAIVVDNGSSDGTAQALAVTCPWVRFIELPTNTGTAARNRGAAIAQGQWLVFLDDDSRPRPGSIKAALEYVNDQSDVAILGGPVFLPDGRQDWGALPLVPPGCGLMVRRSVFLEVGGFRDDLFMAAEEYDLVFRIVQACTKCQLGHDGHEKWPVQRLKSLQFDHDKTPTGRDSARVMALDLRNNLLIAQRYLPRPIRRFFRDDWLRRYSALLRHAGFSDQIGPAVASARRLIAQERGRPTSLLSPANIELLFGLDDQTSRIAAWSRRHHVQRVIIADHCKTLWTTWQACIRCDLEVAAVADNHCAYRGLSYRNVPILPDQEARQWAIDAVVLSNINPAHVETRLAQLANRYDVPVLALWPFESVPPCMATDESTTTRENGIAVRRS